MSFKNTKSPLKADITAKPKWPVPMRPHPKAGVMEYYLEGEIKERFIKLFPIHSTRRIMQWFGISFATCQRFKRELGLTKNMKAIRRELAKDVKKTCEKNGYYDSIRGVAPSQACIEATRRLWASGFVPMNRLKEKSPERYARVMRKRSEARKELIRKEHLRDTYGMKRQTKLRLTIQPLSNRAKGQKHAMIHRNNYFSVPEHPSWVCYDSETQRSARSEATAIRHGLRIVAGEEETDNGNME
jgi:hypothetical protein